MDVGSARIHIFIRLRLSKVCRELRHESHMVLQAFLGARLVEQARLTDTLRSVAYEEELLCRVDN